MTTNIFYRYENQEYTLAEREQLENVFGGCNLAYAEQLAKEKFEEEGFGDWEFLLPNDKLIQIGIVREVDDEDDSNELNVVDDTEGIFSDLTLNTVEF